MTARRSDIRPVPELRDFPRSKLPEAEIIRRLAVLGAGDPGMGFRLLMERGGLCSICCLHRNVCRCAGEGGQ